MKRLHKPGLSAGFILLLGWGLCSPAQALWARPGDPVPVERLIANLKEYVLKHPKEAKGYYTLGRLHSLAFVRGMTKVALYTDRSGKADGLPEFPSYDSILVKPENGEIKDEEIKKLSAQTYRDFRESIRNYRRATELNPKEGLYFLGLGWMLEQGHLMGAKAGAPPANGGRPPGWREQAVAAYRNAYRLSVQKDAAADHIMMGTDVVSIEAAEGIERLKKGQPLSPQAREELEKMRQEVKKIKERPRAVTPIVFPLDGSTSLRQMLTQRTVTFDLAGDDIKRKWEWVKPNVGILVWDPEKKGRISSGRQLFGSVTWWMFWKDGYEPLAALDNNRDGALTGKELEGIAVWRDANSNGISDPGEVVPVRKSGIAGIAVKASEQQEGVLSNAKGLLLQNGNYLPTFDWVPVGQSVTR
jgi:hypothetical protein